ncbi:MAG: protein-L-isoaspartate(D-aspartate) O-methyltransferase [Gammaproteobacteria bacterium]|nr:protein-L-isoaspartate(D-aspartate) O-methyltransferase [Gammaproteobacteria bacterium]
MEYFDRLRQQMLGGVEEHMRAVELLLGRSTLAPAVMQALSQVPRHEFVPAELQGYAYADTPLPIGYDKTVSQPFIVALMTDLLDIGAETRVLEIGTGLGYHAAVLAELSRSVYSVEIIPELAAQAERRLGTQGYDEVVLARADGSRGWAQHAPFDRILVTAAPDLVPPALLAQLAPGGRMVIPAGLSEAQQLLVVDKSAAGRISIREILPVRFAALEYDDDTPAMC